MNKQSSANDLRALAPMWRPGNVHLQVIVSQFIHDIV